MSLSINISDDKKSGSSTPNTSTGSTNGDISSRRKIIRPKESTISRTPLKSHTNKVNSKRRFTKKKIFLFLIFFVFIALAGVAILRFRSFTNEVGIKISANDIINPIKKDPELKKDSTGARTNALLVGIDTRENDRGLQNTDTIIVASFNHQNGEATMISIPRDTYAAIPETDRYVKINGIYNYVEAQDEGAGLEGLVGVVEDYTGLEMQYYAMVDVKGLSSIIDLLGGLDVVVENSFTDYAYPDEDNPYSEYQVVSFEAGPQTMDADTAIKFARSRKSLDNNEGSDFARARRQQKIIEAMKNKVLSTETLLDPQKLLDIMVQVEENIKVSEFTNEDLQAGIKLLKENPDSKVHSFVLDPYAGGRMIITSGAIPESYAITPVAGIGEYDEINAFIREILANPTIYEEDPTIYVYDTGFGYYETYEEATKLQEKYPYLRIIYQGTLYTDKEGIYIYDNSVDGTYKTTPQFLAGSLTDSKTTKPEYLTTRLNGEDVTILYGTPIVVPEPTTEASEGSTENLGQ